MAESMLKFVRVALGPPEKRSTQARKGDFHEIYQPFIQAKAEEQAARCSQCGVPFCQSHCPLQNNIPDWLMLTAAGRVREAYEVAAATNSMPEICGRICPQDRLCEGNCVIEQSGFGTVTIGAVEKHITDLAWENGWVEPIRPPRERPQSVGIIGAGPAGLAAAEALRLKGYKVTVYDRHDRIGGLLVYGIPNFKLDKEVVRRRADRLIEGGVTFVLNCEVGKRITFDALRAKHDAVLVATGVYKARDLEVPNAAARGVLRAMDYLIASNRVGLGDDVPEHANGTLNAKGKKVVVIGGGDTAMDCVRTAVRQGAKSVTCLYRRDLANMPGSRTEVKNAEEEGVHFAWLSAPQAILGTLRKAAGVRVVRMHLGPADNSGRQSPTPTPGSEHDVQADMVIKALGYDPEDLQDAFQTTALKVSRFGTLRVDYRNMSTSLPGVFAAGDIVRGASLVVWAIREGRDAAEAIHAFIKDRATASAMAAE
ncbi:MAG: NAD(P)-dependent oxidoreductase [Caulobacterales bacterium]|jgi:glutamate synthase (NADPH/NADH) small chain